MDKHKTKAYGYLQACIGMTQGSYRGGFVKVSVILPSYNSSKYIEETLRSIQGQSFKDFEVLIVDDGSTDQSLEICKNFSASDNRFKVLTNTRSKGVSGACNSAIQVAKGDYLVRCDADDLSDVMRFEVLVSVMDANPSLGVAGSWMKSFGSENRVWKSPLKHNEILSHFIFGTGIFHPTVIIRKKILQESNILYDEKLKSTEDFDLWVKLSTQTNLMNIPKVLVQYRIHDSNQTVVQKELTRSLALKIISSQLSLHNVRFSEVELRLHSRICFNIFELQADEYFSAIMWVVKLSKHMITKKKLRNLHMMKLLCTKFVLLVLLYLLPKIRRNEKT